MADNFHTECVMQKPSAYVGCRDNLKCSNIQECEEQLWFSLLDKLSPYVLYSHQCIFIFPLGLTHAVRIREQLKKLLQRFKLSLVSCSGKDFFPSNLLLFCLCCVVLLL